MKKVLMAAMTLVMAVFASCTNEDLNVENNDVKVNFTVAEKVGFGADSRAVKTGWEDGDEILIVLYSSGGWYNEDGYNYMKLKYDGSAWTTDLTSLDQARLLNGQKYMAIYHPGTITVGEQEGSPGYYKLSGYKGGEHLLFAGDAVKYTYEGASIDLGTIAFERYVQDFQISVKDLASAGKANGTWELYIQDAEGNDAHNMYFNAADNAFLRDTGFGTYSTSHSTGVNYKGDVVFYFSNAGSNETSLKFLLQIDGGDAYTYTTTTIPEAGQAYLLPPITDPKWTKIR